MAEGWITLSRSICDHWIWQDEPFDKARAWIDLLLLANYEDKKTSCKGAIVECKRGDVNVSIKYLAERWHWSRHKVSDYLNLLEKDNMIAQIRTSKRTYLTIVNYDVYQLSSDFETDIKRTSKGHQKDTTNKVKELNKEKKDIYGEYSHVKLTQAEYERLGSEFGTDIRDKAIRFLDEYCQDKKSYKHNDDNLCIRRWVIDAVKEKQNKPAVKQNSFNQMMQRDYNFADLEKNLLGG